MSNGKEDIIGRFMRDAESKAESLYRKGYKEGKNDGYALGKAMGKADVWDTLRKILSMPNEDFREVFRYCMDEVVRRLDVDTVMQKFAEWEESCDDETLKVGDEVIDPNGLMAIVTNTDTAYHLYYPHNGKTWKAPKTTKLTKTGKIYAYEFMEMVR